VKEFINQRQGSGTTGNGQGKKEEFGLFRRALNHLDDAIHIVDENFDFCFANEASLRNFGCPQEEVIGKSIGELFGRELFETTLRPMLSKCLVGETVAFQRWITFPSGKPHWMEVSYFPLWNGAGEVTHVLARLRDRLKEQEAERSKSRFLAMMSHEIRTPLNGIIGMAEYLHQQEWDDDTLQCLRVINHSGAVLLELINDILDFSKIEAGRMEIRPCEVTLSDQLGALEEVLRQRASLKGLRTELDLRLSGRKYVLDWQRVQQVILNLFSNALKFTSPPGRIVLRVRERATRRLDFEVEDTGIGIPKDEQKKIFEPFRQVEHDGREAPVEQGGGTGLGLSICRSLVERMGGEISVNSVPGAGTTVQFNIEAVPVGVGAAVETGADGQGAPGRAQADGHLLKALILEKRESDAFVLEKMLAIHGIASTKVKGTREAGNQLAQTAYDYLFIGFPMEADSLLTWVEDTLPVQGSSARRPEVFACTTQATPEMRKRCFARGLDGLLEKPLQGHLLEALLRQET